jgi:hypothetical protein
MSGSAPQNKEKTRDISSRLAEKTRGYKLMDRPICHTNPKTPISPDQIYINATNYEWA